MTNVFLAFSRPSASLNGKTISHQNFLFSSSVMPTRGCSLDAISVCNLFATRSVLSESSSSSAFSASLARRSVNSFSFFSSSAFSASNLTRLSTNSFSSASSFWFSCSILVQLSSKLTLSALRSVSFSVFFVFFVDDVCLAWLGHKRDDDQPVLPEGDFQKDQKRKVCND